MKPVRMRFGFSDDGARLPSTCRCRKMSPYRHASAHRGSLAQAGSAARSHGTHTGITLTLSPACWAPRAADIDTTKTTATTKLRIIKRLRAGGRRRTPMRTVAQVGGQSIGWRDRFVEKLLSRTVV